MASVCGSTLALMDAGVPISRPVAGIAMGLVKDGDEFSILSDIQGMEDALGDMDFKVAGTERGITALQMDIKIQGVIWDVLQQALAQAREGRLYILQKMLEVIDAPRAELSPYAPRIFTMEIPVDKIRDVIGPGGKTIRKIIDETGVTIDIEDDGRVYVASTNQEAGYRAQKMIELLVKDVEVGETYLGTVKRIVDFGAFVELLPGKEGLLHISKLAKGRVAKVEDVVQVGETITVKVIEIDHMGRINLARPEALEASENKKGRNGRGKRPRA
jgi:polyribonucleotide nucleotidyltransferase